MSTFLLKALGWKYPSDTVINRCHDARMVVVISHTTYWDFFLFLLYRMVCPEYADDLHVILKPQPFDTFGWLLRNLDCIPATRSESSGKGFVDQTINRFKNEQYFKIAISPKGKTIRSPWRSGYYHIRKGLKCNIAAAGIDYERKCLYFGPIHRHEDIDDLSKEEMANMLKEDMGEVVPLYPELSEAEISRDYDPNRVSLIDWILFILVLTIIIVLIWIIYYVLINNKQRNIKN